MVQLMCGLYGLTIIVLGIVFSVAAAVTHQLGEDSIYLEVRHLFVTRHLGEDSLYLELTQVSRLVVTKSTWSQLLKYLEVRHLVVTKSTWSQLLKYLEMRHLVV